MRKKMLFDMLVWSIATGVLFYFIFMIFNIWFHGEFTIYEPNQFILAVDILGTSGLWWCGILDSRHFIGFDDFRNMANEGVGYANV